MNTISTAPPAAPAAPGAAAPAGQAPTATDAEAERFQRLLQQADPRRQSADKAAQGRTGNKPGPGADKLPNPAALPTTDLPNDGPAPASATATEPAAAAAGTDTAAMLAALQVLNPSDHTPTGPSTARLAGAEPDSGADGARAGAGPGGALAADGVPGPSETQKTQTLAAGFADTLQLQTPADAAPRQAETPLQTPLQTAETAPPLPPLLAAPPAATVHANAPAEARIAASPGSPDFASQLGAQLSTFVREGVQHARLELHPTALGPVTVQIQLEGLQAQVHLSAALADTRQALEQALPQLAGSLREAGLTLSGGGVFEQPRQAPQAPPPSPTRDTRRHAPLEEDGVKSFAAAPTARRRGVVDLVA